jgi:hypothetical protein
MVRHFCERHRADLPGECQGCHRPGEMAPMPLRTYQEARPRGTVDQEQSLTTGDAPVVHRQDDWHSKIQERRLVE